MSGRLFICEKPAQARDIAGVLGLTKKENGYLKCGNDLVTWCVGHLLELVEPHEYDEKFKKFGAIENLPILPVKWKMRVVTDKKTQKPMQQFFVVKALLKDAKEVVIATDSAREGEMIARELLDYCGYKNKVSRLWSSALDTASVKKALANLQPGEKTVGLYESGLARARSDWLIGMNLTRVFTVVYGNHFSKLQQAKSKDPKEFKSTMISMGRVQTPTLSFVVQRDLAIENFVKKTFYKLVGRFKHENGLIEASYVTPEGFLDGQGYCVDKSKLAGVLSSIKNAEAVITKVEKDQKKVQAPLPYDLVAIQQEASDLLKISISEVLALVQSLYEVHKIVTYPRVECRYLPESQLEDVPKVVKACLAMDSKLEPVLKQLDLSKKSRAWNTKKSSESDHHATIPTWNTIDLSVLTSNELTVYQLIRNRYLVQFAEDMLVDETVLNLECQGESFVSKGKAVKLWGWKQLFVTDKSSLRLDSDESDNKDGSGSVQLPIVNQGDTAVEMGSDVTTGITKPPPRYTESTLLTAMVNVADFVEDPTMKKVLQSSKGLGTPATRHEVIATLLSRKFVSKTGGKITSTELGRYVIEHCPDTLKNPATTAVWELAMNEIVKSKLPLQTFMNTQEAMVSKLVAHISAQKGLVAEAKA